ncbi:triose-phosphate isomerase [Mesomycoplasma lagogenitalium]|uniref:Triosephosphate isomerase n=1 Tax=Mesomycoplasma lagogenitalium TaxID=171286 RepID=A0ABY8LX60_9BACT|nr:triose-phosphate isomerase [Mesomycoplasma lagogenitalium]WGI36851.1 triose-phosphate isomerase [Mesomycoplasma lagogenitalium]
MKKLTIIGNWKMNKNSQETKEFLDVFNTEYLNNKEKISDSIVFGIAAPFTNLYLFNKNDKLKSVAQNFSNFSSGAYTGEISASMLKDLNVSMVVLGHSERRQYFYETDETVNLKTHQALKEGITPIVCVGETLEEYEAGKTKEVILKQLKGSLKDVNDFSKIIIAYEPVWAIGTGKTATAEIAQDVCEFIRKNTAANVTIQYGGSVSPANIQELMNQKDIDGALVGGASLKPESFIKLLTLNK